MSKFKEYLVELFDKSWSTENDDKNTEYYRKNIHPHYPDHKITNIHVYKLEGNNGHLVSFHRDGILEAHHSNGAGESGVMNPSTKPNPRFYSTTIHHLETNGINKGRAVNICTAND